MTPRILLVRLVKVIDGARQIGKTVVIVWLGGFHDGNTFLLGA